MAAIVGRSMQVRPRIDQFGGACRRVVYIALADAAALEDLFRRAQSYRGRAGAARGQPREAASLALDRHQRGNPDDREVAMARAELLKGPSGVRRLRRHPHFDQYLT